MTRTEGDVTYTCDKCKAREPAFGEFKVYPKGWGMYEHYPVPGEVKMGDLCGECIKPILSAEPEESEEDDESNLPPETGTRDEG